MSYATNRRCSRRGFTLMELLVVLAILVLLMAMVAPKILGTKKKADINAAKAQIGLLRGALNRYTLDMKEFPTTEQGLDALCEEPSDDSGSSASSEDDSRAERSSDRGDSEKKSNWDGPYLDATSVPKDPWDHSYQYEYPPQRGKGDFPDIWSYGPDGQDDTEDDIVSWTDSDKDSGSSKSDRGSERDSRSSSSSSRESDR